MLYSELEDYFNSRFEELLNRNTPESYRVKTHNVLSIMLELTELIEGWQQYRIQSPETVEICALECKHLMEQDEWVDYSFYDKHLFLNDIEDYVSQLSQSKENREKLHDLSGKLRYSCTKCINLNSGKYADKLFNYLIGEINREGDIDADKGYIVGLQSFDKAISSLCNELLRMGYSKSYLYVKATKLIRNQLTLSNLKKDLLEQPLLTFKVIYKLQGNRYITSCKKEYGLVSNIDETRKQLTTQGGEARYRSFLSSNGNKFFRIFTVKALDSYSATRSAKNSMATLLDTLYLGSEEQKGALDPLALVVYKNNLGELRGDFRSHAYQLDGTNKSNPEMSKRLKGQVDDILNSALVKKDAKERLKSALRHLRMANDSTDLELRFVNYWIALEFLFSSPISNESTFTRIKKHLVNVMCYSYAVRNVHYLDQLLHNENILDPDQSLSQMSDDEWGAIIDKIKDKRSQYRLCKLKASLRDKNKIKDYIKKHRTNLEWQIVRIYRMRNELIHEAALKQDIEGVTSILRFYLVFLLNQLVHFLHETEMPVNINDFFHHYENKSKVILTTGDREYALNASYEISLIC